MGRPKGSKNKPKIPPVATDTVITKITPPKASKPAVKESTVVAPPKQHIVLQFVDYVIDRMDGIEMDAQRKYAKKADRPLKYWLAKSFMDFFRLHDSTLDLAALLKEIK
ncbi:hypothetical protein [Acinetobacter sp.]|uniref:hypothetical protein n=1 Tax=Acinetobacter sp. TaxID=472 RepID=UPI003750824C